MKKILILFLGMLLIGCTAQNDGNISTSITTDSIVTTATTTTAANTTITTSTVPVVKYPKAEYHEQILNGDFSAIAGEYVNGKGEIIKLNEKGLKDEKERVHGDVIYLENYGIYQRPLWWGDQAEGGYTITIYPIGVKVDGFYTDTSIVRISYGQASPMTEEEIYYLQTSPIPEFHQQLMNGDFSVIAGEYINSEGDTLYLNPKGGLGYAILGDTKYNNGLYYLDQRTVDGYGFYCEIFCVGRGVDEHGFDSDTSKIRIICGNGSPMSSNEVYTYNKSSSDIEANIPKSDYYDQIVAGDFTPIVGKYINSEGDVIEINGNKLNNYIELKELNYDKGVYWTHISEYNDEHDELDRYFLLIYDIGVEVSYENMGQLVVVDSDTTKLRLYRGLLQPKEYEIYTKED